MVIILVNPNLSFHMNRACSNQTYFVKNINSAVYILCLQLKLCLCFYRPPTSESSASHTSQNLFSFISKFYSKISK
jgi:hypothetical protein